MKKSLLKQIIAFFILTTFSNEIMAQVQDYATDPAIESNIKSFLKNLNVPAGKPIEQLSPKEARNSFLSKNMMIWFWDAYIPADQRNNIYAAPLPASTEELKGLPPAFIQIEENDILHDQGEAYARKLDEAGVPVTKFALK